MADRNVKVTIRGDASDIVRASDSAARAIEKIGTSAGKANQQAKTGLSGLAQHARDNADARPRLQVVRRITYGERHMRFLHIDPV